ncbi:potassium/sodium hyperpolarization-activated cyclic nucleotide-gated channel protein [Perilla frutescens var. hirtella]|uniref:Potassium/sodium hyperpolarization-activated cyclic nucleotide-gated channel protein n=1 Tax=Perilla frutescens var. hirtella TaxID=608512 RepID=A0AAD4JKM8_PERFH|nr:potassium/sodium hyperpolarization-activated cyclic nucleotide-gated channel protein [Perilla frutescens var. hirtella]KAH6835531.1 potassium/sodium hyperpolarization-activated cyclic nucleotide-gated channel protein [Perilla frutescens var. hirtella]
MASSFQFLHHHHLLLPSQNQIPLNSIPRLSHFTLKCNSEAEFPVPVSETTTKPEEFPMERRRKSEIIRDRNARKGLVKPEPPNFEIGWKRSKEIPTEKPTGYVVMDFLEKLVELMERDFGSAALLAKVGEIVAERATQEAELLREEGKVEDRMLTELSRVLKLMEMDLAMLKAAVKEDTFNQRLQQAKARCRQAILVANSF